jgi:vacuolar-type H+-ATPase subunit F/Vma7
LEGRVEKGLRIAYMGNGTLSLGFKIAGVTEAHSVNDTSEAEAKLKSLIERGDVGIIIVTSSARKLVKDRKLSEAISGSIMPIIIEIPELNENITEEDTLRQLILRAIGIDIAGNV